MNSAPRNIRLTIAYVGTRYCGWQVQPNGPTVQAAVERAVLEVTGEASPVYSAGRTDSGVHALGQVANFQTTCAIPARNLRPALQTRLPDDIVVLDAVEAPLEFHATFSAKRKQYRYLIDNSPVALPFTREFAWQIRRPLDAQAMADAAASLVGTHDFRSFETDWPNKATSVRTVTELRVTRVPLWDVWLPVRIDAQRPAQLSLEPQPGAGEVNGPSKKFPLPLGEGQGEGRSAALPETFGPHPGPPPTGEGVSLPIFQQGAKAQPGECPAAPCLPLICFEITADGFLYNMVRSIVGTLVNVGRGKWAAADVARILSEQRREAAGATAPARGLYLARVDYE
ncbi:MAG: tRNA pseudouridine(38-40) synthase TruA [Planctomycetaceae bacterium]